MHTLIVIDEGIDDQQDESLLVQMRPGMNTKQPKKTRAKLVRAIVWARRGARLGSELGV